MKTTLLICVLLFTACAPSLEPLYTDADLTIDPTLVGTWIEDETGETWTLSNSEKFTYTLVHVASDGRKGEYDARLVKIENELFLDIVPIKPVFSQNDLYKERFVPTHTFVHIVVRNAKVQVSYLEPRWLKDYLGKNPSAIRYVKFGGEILLTSSPKETQKFLLAHLNTREAFSRPTEMTLKRGGQ